jgi:hypothetical protein
MADGGASLSHTHNGTEVTYLPTYLHPKWQTVASLFSLSDGARVGKKSSPTMTLNMQRGTGKRKNDDAAALCCALLCCAVLCCAVLCAAVVLVVY